MIALAFGADADFSTLARRKLACPQLDRLQLRGSSRQPRMIQGEADEVH
jgi:hypothetical protein